MKLRPVIALLLACGLASAQAKPYPDAIAAEGKIVAAFTPQHDVAQLIADQVDASKAQIRVLAFIFTNRKITGALIKAHRRGVKVEIVADREQTMNVTNSTIRDLVNAGVPVWLDSRYAAAHNKVMIFDGLHVLTGSFNFTQAAQSKNAENVLLTLNAKTLAQVHSENFERLRDGAQRADKTTFQ